MLVSGLWKFVLVHPFAIFIHRTVSALHGEGLEAKIRSEVTNGQRYIRSDHGTSDNEPGVISPPGITAVAPEFRNGTNHLPGDDVKLQADPCGLLFFAVVVEPQAAFVVS